MAEDDLAEKEMDLEAVQVSMDIFGYEDDSLDLACKFCERRFDSSGEMGRHIGCKHKLNIHQEVTRDGEAFLSSKLACKLCEKHSNSHEDLIRHQGSMIQNLKQDKLGEKHLT